MQRSTKPWIIAGLTALPVYTILLAVGTLTPQPDSVADPVGWAHFVSTTAYLASHVVTNLVGPILAVLATFALTVLINTSSPRLAPTGLVLSVSGQILLSAPAVISTLVTPAIGRAYLDGNHEVMTLSFPAVTTIITAVALLTTVIGNIIIGIAVARSSTMPRWAGILWSLGTVTFYVLGAALGMATTGASLLTQPLGAALLTVSAISMARAARHRRPGNEGEPSPSEPTLTARS